MRAIKQTLLLLLVILTSACTQKYTYKGNEYNLYEVRLPDRSVHDLALIKGTRTDAMFIDPDLTEGASIQWNGVWRSLPPTPAFRKLIILNFAPKTRPWIVSLLWIGCSVLISLLFGLLVLSKFARWLAQMVQSSPNMRGEWIEVRTGRKVRDATQAEMGMSSHGRRSVEQGARSLNIQIAGLGGLLSLLVPGLFIFTQKIHLIPGWAGFILGLISLVLALVVIRPMLAKGNG